MADLSFTIPAHVWFGPDCVNRLGVVASQYGRRVLLVTEAILYERGVIERVTELLARRNLDPIVFDEIVPNATTRVIDEALRIARGAHVDLVLGLGGVKTLSAAKAVAVAAPMSVSMDDLMAGRGEVAAPYPLVAVPTTCRDPFMFGGLYLVTDARDRSAHLGRSQTETTRAVLVDPKLSVSLPARYLMATMMDTLLHAIEGYVSTGRDFLSETVFAKSIQVCGEILRQTGAGEDEMRPRMAAAHAGVLTAMGLLTTRSGAGSALAYALNARMRVPKSWAATILLPHVLEYNLNATTDELRRVGRLLGEDTGEMGTGDAAGRTIEVIREIIGTCDLPSRLRDFDLPLEEMIEVAEMAHNLDLMNQLPRAASSNDLYEILKAAY
jgi:alcohol dehydrogenase